MKTFLRLFLLLTLLGGISLSAVDQLLHSSECCVADASEKEDGSKEKSPEKEKSKNESFIETLSGLNLHAASAAFCYHRHHVAVPITVVADVTTPPPDRA